MSNLAQRPNAIARVIGAMISTRRTEQGSVPR